MSYKSSDNGYVYVKGMNELMMDFKRTVHKCFLSGDKITYNYDNLPLNHTRTKFTSMFILVRELKITFMFNNHAFKLLECNPLLCTIYLRTNNLKTIGERFSTVILSIIHRSKINRFHKQISSILLTMLSNY